MWEDAVWVFIVSILVGHHIGMLGHLLKWWKYD